MGEITSGAARRISLTGLSIPRTILAIVAVTLAFKFVSRGSVLFVYVVTTGAGGPEIAAFPFLSEILRTLILAFGTAVPFVLIFGLSRPVFQNRWMLYGLIWSCVFVGRWLSGIGRVRDSWMMLALGLVCSVVACIFSAYLTKTILRQSPASDGS